MVANSIFRFKQFEISQNRCAMKVGTDGVLLGAWANTQFISVESKVLDIGTGTGLIALMLSQRTGVSILGIEIDIDASEEAKLNISNSKWRGNISVKNISFQEYYLKNNTLFDLIVSNPPFFINSQKSKSNIRNKARHNDVLLYEDLLYGVGKLLNIKGVFSTIIPFEQKEMFINIANENHLFCTKETVVYPNYTKKPKRVLLEFTKYKTPTLINSLTIETGVRHNYTKEYIDLTKEFYLKM